MQAAIPHLLTLVTSIPATLPHAREELRIEYKTGTTRCVDEVLPTEEDEEDSDAEEHLPQSELVKRNVASLEVIITIGDGLKEISGKEKHKPKLGRGGKRKKNPASVDAGGEDDDAMSTDAESL